LAALALVLGLSGASGAQTPSPDLVRMYHNRPQFGLPVSLDARQVESLREIQLYVKHGNEWTCAEKISPTQNYRFTYRAAEDGEYWFSVVTVDKSGRATPADLRREPPNLIVIVDTHPPEIDVTPVASANGQTLRCDIQHAHADAGKVRVEYETGDQQWRTAVPVAKASNLFVVPDTKNWTGLVRVSTQDYGRKPFSRIVNLKGVAAVPETVVENLKKPSGHAPSTNESRSDKPLQYTEFTPGPAARQFLNSTHAALAYQIDQVGPSGVGRVEIWMTRDEGKTWQRLCEDQKHQSPVECDLPGEGLFGITVVVANGNGLGDPPPSSGDAPDYWIEVDTTKPVAKLLAASPVLGDGAGALLISWAASDKNLDSINLHYAAQREGPWLPIAKGLKNDSSYRWLVPQDAGPEVHLRLEAMDRAGNITVCELPNKIVLDTLRPKARVLSITAVPNRIAMPRGN
jgi:hypothetical protein